MPKMPQPLTKDEDELRRQQYNTEHSRLAHEAAGAVLRLALHGWEHRGSMDRPPQDWMESALTQVGERVRARVYIAQWDSAGKVLEESLKEQL